MLLDFINIPNSESWGCFNFKAVVCAIIRHMEAGLFDLAIIVLIAAALGVAAKLLKQPVILAYIATGLVVAYFGFIDLGDREVFQVFADLGIMFLLFLVGLEINYTSLRLVGKTSVVVGLGQVLFTSLFGFGISTLLGFDTLTSVYIAVALTFSSTIIVVKLLSDRREIGSLYGRISIGFLLVQDIVAVLALIFLSGIGSSSSNMAMTAIVTLIKGVALFVIMLWLGRKILPLIFEKIARSQELLFLTSIAWVFLLAALIDKIGFSIEIAGLLAGLALANSSEHFEISHKIRSLRDFFILIFFVILGSSVVLSNFAGLTTPIIVLSLFVLIGNPLIILILMGLMGYKRRTSFFAGVTVAQISEFSLVLGALGLKLGHITEQVLAIITAVGIITIALSTYMIVHADKIFTKLSPVLKIFEKKKTKESEISEEDGKSVILIGCHRTGESIALGLPKEDLLLIDFDPEVVQKMKRKGYSVLFGDMSDEEIFESAGVSDARLLISTSPKLEDNLGLLTRVNLLERRPKVVVRSDTEDEAKILYERGADYVLLPHFTSGQYLGKTIALNPKMEILTQLRENDLALIRQIDR